jgi:hypothetical protein
MSTQEYISLEVLAAKLRLPLKYLRELAKTNSIPSLNVNGRLRFNPVSVQQALDRIAEQGGNGDD